MTDTLVTFIMNACLLRMLENIISLAVQGSNDYKKRWEINAARKENKNQYMNKVLEMYIKARLF